LICLKVISVRSAAKQHNAAFYEFIINTSAVFCGFGVNGKFNKIMSRIRILPENLSNKIAAGEVVERPCSVVKELVENAVDAQADRIIIEVENGGKSLIRVSDNGIGMNADDAMLSLERYATSKIYKDNDLFSIKTLGFRGEAIPSIASVSRFSLVTNDEDSKIGTEIIVNGGRIKKVSQTGAPQGTMITVGSLFYNIPARRKFLKTASTEMGHIADVISSIALGNPKTGFRLYHNQKSVKNWLPASDPLDRVMEVTGTNLKSDFFQLQCNEEFISVSGWILSPRIFRSTSRGIYIYVNQRFVRDRVIQHALFEGYRQKLIKGRFPVAVLFINVPFEHVDVNVHPAKQEVKFVHQKQVHKSVEQAVLNALRKSDNHKWKSSETHKWEPAGHYNPAGRTNNNLFVSESAESYTGKEIPPHVYREQPKTDNHFHDKKICFADLRIIGQIHDTYIACESDQGLVLIDQHAAHERIVFERLKARYADSKGPDQRLLIPETFDLSFSEAEILERLMPEFCRLGLEIEPFGSNTFAVSSVPAILAEKEIRPIVMEIVEKIAETGFGPDIEKAVDKCLILMACHGAIRANQSLSETEIKALLDQLDHCENPSNCPHGRPTWIKWSIIELEKMFGRRIGGV